MSQTTTPQAPGNLLLTRTGDNIRVSWERSRLVGLLAVALPVSVAPTGCADDAFLLRDAPAVSMPVFSTLGADQATVDETGRNPVTAGEGQTRRYLVAIGRVVLENHAGDDFFSSPDIFVQVQRRDPEFLGSIRLAEERLAALGERRRAAEEERQPLRARQSDNEPGNEPVVLL